MKTYHLQQFIAHDSLTLLNFFCTFEIFHILLSTKLQGGLFVCEGKSNVRQTCAAHGNLDSACSYLQRWHPVKVIQKIPSACWLLPFLTVYIFNALFWWRHAEHNMTGTVTTRESVIKPEKIMVANGLLGELTLSSPFQNYQPYANDVLDFCWAFKFRPVAFHECLSQKSVPL